MAENDQAILVTHQPRWLSDWFWDETACHNLRQLVRGHLRGRARVHLAGGTSLFPDAREQALCLSLHVFVRVSVHVSVPVSVSMFVSVCLL